MYFLFPKIWVKQRANSEAISGETCYVYRNMHPSQRTTCIGVPCMPIVAGYGGCASFVLLASKPEERIASKCQEPGLEQSKRSNLEYS